MSRDFTIPGTGATTRDPMLDAIDCSECGKEFIPKRDGQTTCGRAACNGGKGARTRDYRKPKANAKGKRNG